MPEAFRNWTKLAAVALLPLLVLMSSAQADEKPRLRAADIEALAFLALAPIDDGDLEARLFDVLRAASAEARADLRAVIAEARGRKAKARFAAAYSDLVVHRLVAEAGGADASLFAVMMAYQKLVAAEAREDRRLAKAQMRGALADIAAMQGPAEAARSRAAVKRWLFRLRDQLRGVSGGELQMIDLQSLVSQRQMAIQLASRILAAMDEAARRVAGNVGGGGSGQGKRAGGVQGASPSGNNGPPPDGGGSGDGTVDYGGCAICGGGGGSIIH